MWLLSNVILSSSNMTISGWSTWLKSKIVGLEPQVKIYRKELQSLRPTDWYILMRYTYLIGYEIRVFRSSHGMHWATFQTQIS